MLVWLSSLFLSRCWCFQFKFYIILYSCHVVSFYPHQVFFQCMLHLSWYQVSSSDESSTVTVSFTMSGTNSVPEVMPIVQKMKTDVSQKMISYLLVRAIILAVWLQNVWWDSSNTTPIVNWERRVSPWSMHIWAHLIPGALLVAVGDIDVIDIPLCEQSVHDPLHEDIDSKSLLSWSRKHRLRKSWWLSC